MHGDHLQIWIANHWDGWDENLHFYRASDALPAAGWEPCSEAHEVHVPHMGACVHVALFNGPSYQ